MGKIGYMLMSNEAEAFEIIQDWNKHAQNLGRTDHITHVLVFTVFDSSGNDLNYGDEAKWVWFVRIANQTGMPVKDEIEYANVTSSGTEWTELGKQTIIYKMMQNAKNNRVSSVPLESLTYFAPAYFSNMNREDLWNIDGINAVVAIYEVVY
jgi:hypothetical protein